MCRTYECTMKRTGCGHTKTVRTPLICEAMRARDPWPDCLEMRMFRSPLPALRVEGVCDQCRRTDDEETDWRIQERDEVRAIVNGTEWEPEITRSRRRTRNGHR